jgi:hypothetical protein
MFGVSNSLTMLHQSLWHVSSGLANTTYTFRSRNSLVGIVARCRLPNWHTISFLVRLRDYFHWESIHIGSGAHLVYYSIGGRLFSWGYSGEAVKLRLKCVTLFLNSPIYVWCGTEFGKGTSTWTMICTGMSKDTKWWHMLTNCCSEVHMCTSCNVAGTETHSVALQFHLLTLYWVFVIQYSQHV